MHKEKPKRAGRQFPVTFVVDQQLEACIHAIKRSSRLSLATEKVQVELVAHQSDSDAEDGSDIERVGFGASLYQHGTPMTNVWGTMRRWQGTSTRIEGYARTLRSDASHSMWWATIAFNIFIFSVGFLYIVNVVQAQPQPRFEGWWVLLLPFFPLILYITVSIGVALLNAYLNKRRLIGRLRRLLMAESATVVPAVAETPKLDEESDRADDQDHDQRQTAVAVYAALRSRKRSRQSQ